MRVLIQKTYKTIVVATSETNVSSAAEYIMYLGKFNVQMDMIDAVADIKAGAPVSLVLPIEMDYSLNA